MYPSLSRAYKKKISDEPLRDAVHEEDKNMEVEFRESGIPGVDNGDKVKFDMRENPERAGFPRGDSRRW
jgi:hypothetical protein